ncbi:5'-3' exonuclease family protein [Striga asiatica]|uniref:5'-3' exonuclease family protein n=1 Tax=Striga asiatica TaxID=4170 RepID=A0A5A7RC91_STRAF|nr:5'-3' exonuclease family protein [Striga asiatica]
MAQPAKAHYAKANPRLVQPEKLHRAVRSDSSTEKRTACIERHAGGPTDHKMLVTYHDVRVASVSRSPVEIFAPVREDHIWALVFEVVLTAGARTTRACHATDPNLVPDFDLGHAGAHLGHDPRNLVAKAWERIIEIPGENGVGDPARLVLHAVEIRMANPTVQNLQFHVFFPSCPSKVEEIRYGKQIKGTKTRKEQEIMYLTKQLTKD